MKILRKGLAALVAVALSAPAFAADLPTRKGMATAPQPFQPAYTFTWTGPYLGAFAGGNWASVRSSDLAGFGGAPRLNSNGLTAGGLAGYNWGWNGFVIGLEAEAGYDKRSSSTNYNIGPVPWTIADDGRAEARLRGRLGWGWDRFMLFVAGGGSVQDQRITLSNPGMTQQLGTWRGGFNLGGGVDWAFSDHWVIRGEYIYDRFGNRDFGFNPASLGARSVRLDESTARAALMYKF